MTIQDPISGQEVDLDSIYMHEKRSMTTDYPDSCSLAPLDSKMYNSDYMAWLFSGSSGIPQANSLNGVAFKNGIPARTRVQGVKEAMLRAWVKYYDQVYWAFRGLQGDNDSNGTREDLQGTKIWTDSRRGDGSNGSSLYFSGNTIRRLILMNSDSLGSMKLISSLLTSYSTPLTYATANALAQFNDPSDSSVFNSIYSSSVRPQDCTYHFLILFTDGRPINDANGTNMDSPYLDSSLRGKAEDGNAVLASNRQLINPNNKYWNIMNLAAAAAHLGNSLPVKDYPISEWPKSGGKDVSDLLPFWINKRGGSQLDYKKHPIQTMTVGVSLTGSATDANSPKARLFRAAALGDPRRTSWDLKQLKPFEIDTNPNSPNYGKKDPNSVYFFDAADPEQLVDYLDRAFYEATNMGGNVSSAAPALPTVGASLGNQIYLAQFSIPESSKMGPVWSGDLLMFPVREVNGQTRILDANGDLIKGEISSSKAVWSASSILRNRTWKNRIVYTRRPATSSDTNPPLIRVRVDGQNPTDDQGFRAIRDLLPGSDDNSKLFAWKYLVGADLDGLTTRSNIMGDVINSSPAVMNYTSLPSSVASISPALANAWSQASASGRSLRQFRLVVVGDNQGFMHGFGEVSWVEPVVDSSGNTFNLTRAVADELWAFVPTDVLPYIDYFLKTSNPHRYALDGSPTAYLLDRPQGAKEVIGNGKFDVGSSNEDALIIFGLGKGGRSYYALDVKDPGAPSMRWSLCPDEPSNWPSGRFLMDGGLSGVISKMGYSTAIPTPARMIFGHPPLVNDFIFLGGGYSVPEIEANYPTPGANSKLGRCVIALEATTGRIARVWDLSKKSGLGPISGGVIPYEFVRGSGIHTRAYFTDYYGGLWALGGASTSTAPATKGFRLDTPRLDQWAPDARALFKQAPNNGLVSTWPVPFSLPTPLPVRASDPKVSPAAVGIAWVTGDRMNPLDQLYGSNNPKPTQHRLNVFFDRQDSALLGIDANGANDGWMYDFTNNSRPGLPALDPSNKDYYLKSKLGYYINFPSYSSDFVAKGVIPPLLLGGAIFYSAFLPTSVDPCSGGQGETYTYRICNVIHPVASNSDAAYLVDVDGCKSGRVLKFSGVAGQLAARSPITVVQAGVNPIATDGSGNGDAVKGLQIKSMQGTLENRFVRPRMWRSVR